MNKGIQIQNIPTQHAHWQQQAITWMGETGETKHHLYSNYSLICRKNCTVSKYTSKVHHLKPYMFIFGLEIDSSEFILQLIASEN